MRKEKEDTELTFTPKILKKETQSDAIKIDKFEMLYQTGKIKTAQKREAEEKTADEAAMEKDPSAFTFKPEVKAINVKTLAAPPSSSKRSKSRKTEDD